MNETLSKVVERHGGQNAQHIMTTIATIELAKPATKWLYSKYKSRKNVYTITVEGTDSIYPAIHTWVLERMPARDRKAMVVRTHRDDPPYVRLMYDGSREQEVEIDGRQIAVSVSKEALPDTNHDILSDLKRSFEKITFSATSIEGRDAIVEMIEGLVNRTNDEARPTLLIPSRWGGEWQERGDLPERTMESVILKSGQLEMLTHDFDTFLNSEERYGQLSQPYHRGYLFHGPPGTGKTSVARALANHFALPIYYLPIRDLEKDTNLMTLIASVKSRSVLLIEDIDCYNAATSREEQPKEASIAAMLNALDGIWTPHGLITIMTTNNREALDDALIRAGRVSVFEEFGMLNYAQAQKLANFLDYNKNITTFVGQSPAALIDAASKDIL